MDRLSYYKSFYDNELKKRDELDKSINNPVIIITIIFGILSYIVKNYTFIHIEKLDRIILSYVLIICILICISIYHLIISYNNGVIGFPYEILGSNTEYEKYRNELFKFYKGDNSRNITENEFEEYIISEFVKCSDINYKLNIKRTYHNFLTKKYIIISLIITFITFIIHLSKQIIL